LTIKILSSSSRRRVCDHAFADRVRSERLGWTGQGPDVIRSEDSVERPAESAGAVPEHKLEGGDALGEVHQQVAGGLGGPCSGRVCAHLEQMCSAGAMLDCDQDLDPPEHDGVHGHEVHGEDGLGLGGKELAPGWTRSRWGGIKCRRRAESATPWRQRCDHLDARIG
jgi:hypothetical protein